MVADKEVSRLSIYLKSCPICGSTLLNRSLNEVLLLSGPGVAVEARGHNISGAVTDGEYVKAVECRQCHHLMLFRR